jgi:hypothetical protein
VPDSQDAYPNDPDRSRWTIRASATEGGYITPDGDVLIEPGDSQSFSILARPGFIQSDLRVDGVSLGTQASYLFSAVAAEHSIEAIFTPVPNGLSFASDDAGLPGLDRIDGGNDANNLVDGLPKADVEYRFRVLLRNLPGSPVSQPWLVLDGYAYPMAVGSGDFATGVPCTFVTRLGPSAVHSFHFEARDAGGNLVWRLPMQDELAGPKVELLNGRNLIGLSRNVGTALRGPVASMGSSRARYWAAGVDGQGPFVPMDAAFAVKAGEGYFMQRESSSTLPALSAFDEVTQPSFDIPLSKGWNLIANPYGGIVLLADVLIQKSGSPAVSWLQAADFGWTVNALFSYNGSDWGNGYAFESAGSVSEPVLVPWVGYWIYLNGTGGDYALVVPRPAR